MLRLLLAVIATAWTSLAFAGEPPADFLGLKVGYPYGGEKGTNVSLGQLASFMSKALPISWDKQSDSQWIMNAEDKMSGSTSKFLFTNQDGLAMTTRIVSKGKDIPQAMFPNFMRPLLEKAAFAGGTSMQTVAEAERKAVEAFEANHREMGCKPKDALLGKKLKSPDGKSALAATVSDFATAASRVGAEVKWFHATCSALYVKFKSDYYDLFFSDNGYVIIPAKSKKDNDEIIKVAEARLTSVNGAAPVSASSALEELFMVVGILSTEEDASAAH